MSRARLFNRLLVDIEATLNFNEPARRISLIFGRVLARDEIRSARVIKINEFKNYQRKRECAFSHTVRYGVRECVRAI